MEKTTKRILTAVLFLGFAGSLSVARADDLEKIRAQNSDLIKARAETQTQIESVQKELQSLSAEIQKLKRKSASQRSVLGDYRLRGLLTKAQEVSDRLHQLTEKEKETGQALARKTDDLLGALTRAIDSARVIANSKTEPMERRRVAARELQNYSLEKINLTADRDGPSYPNEAKSLLGNATTQDDAEDRLNAIRDFESRMLRERSQVEQELAEIRKQRFVRNELAYLMEEETFFAEQGFVRGAATKQAPAVAASGPTTTGTPASAATLPTDTQPGVANPMITPATAGNPGIGEGATRSTPSSSGVGPSSGSPISSAAETTGETRDATFSMRDPLVQLATSLGLPADERKEISSSPSQDALADHIHWLERRLVATRFILERLQQQAQKLESRLHHP